MKHERDRESAVADGTATRTGKGTRWRVVPQRYNCDGRRASGGGCRLAALGVVGSGQRASGQCAECVLQMGERESVVGDLL